MKFKDLLISKFGIESIEAVTGFLLEKHGEVKITCEEDFNVINLLKENNIDFTINEMMNGTKYIVLL